MSISKIHGEPAALAPGVLRALLLRALTLAARRLVVFVFFAVLPTQTDAAAVTTFDDIEFWTGTGANRSALAIDWQGEQATDNSLVWGFRWNGTVKGVDMLTAIVMADDRLYAKMGPISDFGFAVVGLGYDANHDGLLSLTQETSFDEHGISMEVPSDGVNALNGDWYAEGWLFEHFWNYGIATASPFAGGKWERSGGGISSRTLADGSWDSLAYTLVDSLDYAQNPLAAEVSGNADFDGDGDVDGRDFLAWQRGIGILTGALPADGDANGDGAVDSADLAFWTTQYGTNSNTLVSPLTIPEPATGLLVIAFVFLLPRFLHQLDRRIVS